MSKDALYTVIKSPVVSEKSMIGMQVNNEYQFLVDNRANRSDVKKAVEKVFNVKVEKISLPIKTSPGITTWENKKYSEEVKLTCRVYPQTANTEGFFIARLRKGK